MYKHHILDSIQHYLYVCHVDNLELSKHLSFREYLRNNKIEGQLYEELKLKIAKKANQNHKEYDVLKELLAKDFIEDIIKKSNKEKAYSTTLPDRINVHI
ncbi:GrpB family protein [Tenacibaculum sp. MEBiC06402]|uniref:GrpB family protein n=1 Tax=unclassified Tenacibaculum TaxID=2635139 RepID=UPI003B9A2F8E